MWRCSPMRSRTSSFTRFSRSHTRRATIGRIPLDEWSVRRRDLYLTTHNTHNGQTSMPPAGSNSQSQQASGHWGRRFHHPITGLERPWGFQEVEAPRFQDNRHMKVVRLSAPRTGRLYLPGNIPGTHFCYRLSQPQGQNATARITSMKNSNGTIGNRTRNLPVCSTVPQPTTPPRTPPRRTTY
jgi:hypothetical protein